MKKAIHSLEETKEFAQDVAKACKSLQLVITLDGDLGAGKTTWTQFFAKELGVKEVVNSPTFTIMKSYTQGNGEPLYHIDAYRLEGIHQDLGFEDCFDEGICVVEWADFIKDQLPEDILSIFIAEGMDENRMVTIEASGPKSQSVMEALDD